MLTLLQFLYLSLIFPDKCRLERCIDDSKHTLIETVLHPCFCSPLQGIPGLWVTVYTSASPSHRPQGALPQRMKSPTESPATPKEARVWLQCTGEATQRFGVWLLCWVRAGGSQTHCCGLVCFVKLSQFVFFVMFKKTSLCFMFL